MAPTAAETSWGQSPMTDCCENPCPCFLFYGCMVLNPDETNKIEMANGLLQNKFGNGVLVTGT